MHSMRRCHAPIDLPVRSGHVQDEEVAYGEQERRHTRGDVQPRGLEGRVEGGVKKHVEKEGFSAAVTSDRGAWVIHSVPAPHNMVSTPPT